MAKLKTKSSAKKRFKVTASGKILFYSAYLQHNTSKKPAKMKRQNRGSQVMSSSDAKSVRKYMLRI